MIQNFSIKRMNKLCTIRCDQDCNLRGVSENLRAEITSLELRQHVLHLAGDHHSQVHGQMGRRPVCGGRKRQGQRVERLQLGGAEHQSAKCRPRQPKGVGRPLRSDRCQTHFAKQTLRKRENGYYKNIQSQEQSCSLWPHRLKVHTNQ